MIIITAFLFGFLGSFHCAAMCGPIALALPISSSKNGYMRIYYNIGRVLTYTILGLLIGFFGRSFVYLGLQRYLSIGSSSLLVLIALHPFIFKKDFAINIPFSKLTKFVKSIFKNFIQQKSAIAFLIIGLANGILPCGFVYLALGGALSIGTIEGSALYMAIFGLGTIPMMLSISMSSSMIQKKYQTRLRKIVPYIALIMGLILIVRGVNYIPHDCCHH